MLEDGGFYKTLPLQQRPDLTPGVGKVISNVQIYRGSLRALGDHEIFVAVFEYVWVGQMIMLAEHDPIVRPGFAVRTGRETNFTLPAITIEDLEEHVPLTVLLTQKGIGDECCGDVADVLSGEDGMTHIFCEIRPEGRVSSDYRNGKFPNFRAESPPQMR